MPSAVAGLPDLITERAPLETRRVVALEVHPELGGRAELDTETNWVSAVIPRLPWTES